MTKLHSIQNFGGIDAESDTLLSDAFEDHQSYRDALNFSKTLLIGRKGSGKSAIFEKLSTLKTTNSQTFGFTFSNYPWDYHNLQKQAGVPLEERYRESWKYFICMMNLRAPGTHKTPQPRQSF